MVTFLPVLCEGGVLWWLGVCVSSMVCLTGLPETVESLFIYHSVRCSWWDNQD